ncbi:MAG: quinoprotein relay system zinc metallohydrolase 2 [Geminicoccaceae bacterium]
MVGADRADDEAEEADRRRFLWLAGAVAVGAGSAISFPAHRLQATGFLREIVPGVYVRQGVHELVNPANAGHIANVGWVVGEEAVAVVDTGSTVAAGRELREAIRAVTDLPIRYVIATHVHPDHVFGHAAFLADSPNFVGHRKLPAALDQRGGFYLDNLMESLGELAEGTEVVMPDLLVEDVLDIDLGGRKLTLRAHATAHTDNDLTVLDQASGVLFAGDLLFMERCPVVDGSLLGWVDVIDDIHEIGAKTVVPGHGPAHASPPGAFEPQTRYLTTLRDSVRAFLADGGLLEDAVRALPLESERPHWALFDETHGRNISAAYAELEWE